MKPRNREINIFNMSMLDILTGALGAFCFMTLALMPTYAKARSQKVDPDKPLKGYLLLFDSTMQPASCAKLKFELANKASSISGARNHPTPWGGGAAYNIVNQPARGHYAIRAVSTGAQSCTVRIESQGSDWTKSGDLVLSPGQTKQVQFDLDVGDFLPLSDATPPPSGSAG
ncbi:MAG TPA: hypothetical protein VJN94_01465 [Candidatus Binataceae bacterium]|nr:hypothetical protein [Candidatus Binataceae bacterium]